MSAGSPETAAPEAGLFAAVRAATAAVLARTQRVRIDPAGVEACAERLAKLPAARPTWDLDTHHRGSDASTLAYVLTLDTINFGSGWFPYLRKRSGRSGYFTVAMGLKDRFEARGPFRAEELMRVDAELLASVFGQDRKGAEVHELLGLFAEALRELGALVTARYAGRFEGIVEEAGGSAEGLVRTLLRLASYRDVARYQELSVPFLKRAQLAAADLALAFEGRGIGAFRDLDALTAFADNLVPHVLRLEGVLVYDADLVRRIDAGEPIPAGSPEEVAIRAGAVQGVEKLAAALRRRGRPVAPCELDFQLWHAGQRPEVKAKRRHRTRTIYY